MSKYYAEEDVIKLIVNIIEVAEENNDIVIIDTPSGYETKEDYAIEALADLPTIEVSEDCSDYYKGYCARHEDGCFHQCKDCISREWVKGICEAMLDEEMLGHMLGYIEDAPSVVPTVRENRQIERAEGEWIDCDSDSLIYDDIRCSICGMKFTVDAERKTDIGFTIEDLNYCPNCGARMKG